MKASIVMSTRNKGSYLARTLASIRIQKLLFPYEIVVADDGSTDGTKEVCDAFKVEKYLRLENDSYRNPSKARNAGYKVASGQIIIAQSDDVIHRSHDTIELLVTRLFHGEFVIATVYNYDVKNCKQLQLYTGLEYRRPFFFLGSLWRRDLYLVGGNDEEFVSPGYDDDMFARCLIEGLGLVPRYVPEIVGYHQDHSRPPNLAKLVQPSKELFQHKIKIGQVVATGGPWEYDTI